MKKILAKPISYYPSQRALDKVEYIVIHYTGNRGDTAENNAKYYQNWNERQAGAHYFVDRKGIIVQSIPIKYIAKAVGGAKYNNNGGKLYGKASNSNSVSIELCDILNCYPSEKQIKAVKKLIKHIRKNCPNAKQIIRHYDINGKGCPASMCGTLAGDLAWMKFIRDLNE